MLTINIVMTTSYVQRVQRHAKPKNAMHDHNIIQNKQYVCDVRNARYSTRYGLARHIRSHNKEKQQCQKCSKYFSKLKPRMKRCETDTEGR